MMQVIKILPAAEIYFMTDAMAADGRRTEGARTLVAMVQTYMYFPQSNLCLYGGENLRIK